MKKLFFLPAGAALLLLPGTGCETLNYPASKLHDTAVSFAKTTSKAKVQEKIQEMVDEGRITETCGKELSEKADTELDALFAKIDEYYEKYTNAQESGSEEK